MSTPEELLLLESNARRFTQERARKTFESLVAAADALFVERGFDATQTPDIAARAGVSVGTFYRYFSDKKEIYLEVTRRHLLTSYQEIMGGLTPDRFEGKGKRATIEETLRILLDNVTRYPDVQRVFMEMALRDDDVAHLRNVTDDAARKALTQLISVICPDGEVADPEATAHMIHASVVECSNVIAGNRGPMSISRERGLDALTDLVYRALFGTAER